MGDVENRATFLLKRTRFGGSFFFKKKKIYSNRLIPKWSGSGVGKENAHSRICVLVGNMWVRFILS